MTLPMWIQTYVERQTAAAINEQVEKRSNKMEFLRSSMNTSCTSSSSCCSGASHQIALFHRREVQTGSLLGQGNFSDVYEVTRFKLLRSGPASQSPMAEDARLTCCWNAKKSKSSCKYAIKLPKKPERKDFLGSSSRRSRSRSSQDGTSQNGGKFAEYTKASIDLILEGKFLSALDHKNIIKVRGLSCGPSPFLIMDRLVDTLAERLEQWRANTTANQALVWKERANYALQIAEAIEYLHQRRLIVRDLKPANIGFKKGIQGQDQVQLFDFGLCRELPQSLYFEANEADQIFRMSMAGTLRYMSVEQVNTGFYGLKSDVYSWAIVSYEMMTLEVPYANICNNQAMHRRFVCQGGERPTFPKDTAVPECLQELIQEGWSQDIPDRPTMASVCYRMEEILDDSMNQQRGRSSSPSAEDMASLIAACNSKLSAVNSHHYLWDDVYNECAWKQALEDNADVETEEMKAAAEEDSPIKCWIIRDGKECFDPLAATKLKTEEEESVVEVVDQKPCASDEVGPNEEITPKGVGLVTLRPSNLCIFAAATASLPLAS